VLVDNNTFTLYQITEPLQSSSSATVGSPAPYGTDFNGQPLNDPIPDTVLDGTTGGLTSPAAVGTSALLDKWSITKPDVSSAVSAQLSAPPSAVAGGALVYTIIVKNNSTLALNGAQVRLTLPSNAVFAGSTGDNLTIQGSDVVYTMGRLAAGSQQIVQLKSQVPASATVGSQIVANAAVVSGTALPVASNATTTKVVRVPGLPVF
jgi:uncharacterized repeat protein (TIGR01451 family)